MRSKSHRCTLILIGICMSQTACNSGAPSVEFGKVHGTVRVNGRPQPKIQVIFSPDKEKGIKLPAVAGAETDQQGNYALRYSYHNKTGEGAPVGWSRVTLSDMSVGYPRDGQPLKPSAIPPNYSAADSTPLLYEVKSGDNTIDLDVKK